MLPVPGRIQWPAIIALWPAKRLIKPTQADVCHIGSFRGISPHSSKLGLTGVIKNNTRGQ